MWMEGWRVEALSKGCTTCMALTSLNDDILEGLGIVLLNLIVEKVKAATGYHYHLINPATHVGQSLINR